MSSKQLLKIIKTIYRIVNPPAVTWTGDYANWQLAGESSRGYSGNEIADQAFNATLKAINGSAAYARDGVCFEIAEYNWQLVALVYRLSLKLGRNIRVLDFGGAFGDSFIQNLSLIGGPVASWTVVEQDSMHTRAKELPFVEKLAFETLPNIKKNEVDLILLSSVLQYLSEPDGIIRKLVGLNAHGILVDRTGFVPNDRKIDRITKQSVRPPIYNATYPCRFFEKSRFITQFRPYKPAVEWNALDVANIPSQYLGMYFERPNE